MTYVTAPLPGTDHVFPFLLVSDQVVAAPSLLLNALAPHQLLNAAAVNPIVGEAMQDSAVTVSGHGNVHLHYHWVRVQLAVAGEPPHVYVDEYDRPLMMTEGIAIIGPPPGRIPALIGCARDRLRPALEEFLDSAGRRVRPRPVPEPATTTTTARIEQPVVPVPSTAPTPPGNSASRTGSGTAAGPEPAAVLRASAVAGSGGSRRRKALFAVAVCVIIAAVIAVVSVVW